ncbi:histone-like nucleoid-structuring protein Lsr2 [Sphaerimonospora cavernae]|uniref:Histone-like nucleoid-structuring protein Lsr2 n=1 Tax=Sphaerimonospora cavernae TaxID=1740611 RepID=A0ABV6U6B0_9ACTN
MSDDDFTPLRVTRLAYGRDISLAIREWARANGHPVSDRGRVAYELVDAFFAANPEAYEQAGKIELVRATARTPGASPAVLALASRISGVMVTPKHAERPVLGAANPR